MGEEKIMALFNRAQDSSNYVTRDEITTAYEEITSALAEVRTRVTALEELAARLRGGDVRVTDAIRPTPETPAYDRSGIHAAARGEDVPAGRAATASAPGRVDYGAVAFGLAEIKRKITLAGLRDVSDADAAREYAGAVQYFCDVFAKSDPDFNADTFKRQAGA